MLCESTYSRSTKDEQTFQCRNNIKIFLELQLSEVFVTTFVAKSTKIPSQPRSCARFRLLGLYKEARIIRDSADKAKGHRSPLGTRTPWLQNAKAGQILLCVLCLFVANKKSA
jgi:hypothetical protein